MRSGSCLAFGTRSASLLLHLLFLALDVSSPIRCWHSNPPFRPLEALLFEPFSLALKATGLISVTWAKPPASTSPGIPWDVSRMARRCSVNLHIEPLKWGATCYIIYSIGISKEILIEPRLVGIPSGNCQAPHVPLLHCVNIATTKRFTGDLKAQDHYT